MLLLDIWSAIREEAVQASKDEPALADFYQAAIIEHDDFEAAVAFYLARKLSSQDVPAKLIGEVFAEAMAAEPSIVEAMLTDIQAYKERDPACDQYSMPFLYFKGFHALQSYRIAHWLWQQKRSSLALFFQNQISQIFAVDIHPGARIGRGVMIDHATGVVVGETAVIEDKVSILHAVTLGGTGCETGDRHPKIRQGVLISAGAKILGNIEVGEGAKVGAGSVVLDAVPAHTTVAGIPAKVVGVPRVAQPALAMDHQITYK